MDKVKLAHISLFFVALIWAANYTIAKTVMPEYIKPFGLVAFRVLIVSIIFIFIYRFTHRKKTVTKKAVIQICFAAFFGIVINKLFFFKGLSDVEPITASFIMTLTPIMVFILSFFLSKTNISYTNILGLIIAWMAAIFIIFENYNLSNFSMDSGALMLLISASAYAYHLILLKKLSDKYDTIAIMTWSLIFGVFFILPIGYEELTQVIWANIPLKIWLSIMFILFFATIVTYFLTMWATKYVEAHIVGIYSYIQPLLAVIIAVSVGADTLTIKKSILGLLILVGVYLVNTESKKCIIR